MIQNIYSSMIKELVTIFNDISAIALYYNSIVQCNPQYKSHHFELSININVYYNLVLGRGSLEQLLNELFQGPTI